MDTTRRIMVVAALLAACGGCALVTSSSEGTTGAGGGPSTTSGGGASPAGSLFCQHSASVVNPAGMTSTVSMTCTDTSRVLTANGIPDHATGAFPNAGNPNTIRAQTVSFSAPRNPAKLATTTAVRESGCALNGIKLEPGTAESYQNAGVWRIEALGQTYFKFGVDQNNAHVQPTGAYHYHGMPEGYMDRLGKGTAMTLVAFAADGFPVYARYGFDKAADAASALRPMVPSYRMKAEPAAGRPATSAVAMGTFTQDYEYVEGLGDLDDCNGRTGVTPEFPAGIYHYYITDGYPYIQRCVKGTAASAGGPPGGGPPGGGPPPRDGGPPPMDGGPPGPPPP